MHVKQLALVAAAPLFCALMAGCGLTTSQKAAVRQFSAAAADVGDLAAAEFASSRADVIEMNQLRVALNDPSVDDDQPLDGRMSIDHYAVRVGAAKALKDYGLMLDTLATSSETDAIKVAADSFVASLKKVDGVSLSADEAGAIGAAVQAVGGLLIEAMRKDAVRQVVAIAEPHVRHIVVLLDRSFDQEDDYWALEFDTTEKALRGVANFQYVGIAEARLKTTAGQLSKALGDLEAAQAATPVVVGAVTAATDRAAAARAAHAAADVEMRRAVPLQSAGKAAEAVRRQKAQRFASAAEGIRLVAGKLDQAHREMLHKLTSDAVTSERVTEFLGVVEQFVQIYEALDKEN